MQLMLTINDNASEQFLNVLNSLKSGIVKKCEIIDDAEKSKKLKKIQNDIKHSLKEAQEGKGIKTGRFVSLGK